MNRSLGLVLVVIGGFMQGTYFLGLKNTDPWKWENIWSVFSLFALVVMPVFMVYTTVPRVSEALSVAPIGALAGVFLFGVGWGIGAVLAGLGVDRMGLAMGVAVIIGISAALGALIPLAVDNPHLVFQPKGLMVISSVIVLLAGVAVVGIAGKKRDDAKAAQNESGQKGNFMVGLLICVFSGIFSCMLNLAFGFGKPVAQAAAITGASQGGAQNFVWLVALLGGFIANAIYTGFLLTRNKTWKNFTRPRSGVLGLVGFGMAFLWYAGVLLYGRGAVDLGQIGVVVGWPVFMATMIIVSGFWGFVTGEWKGASSRAKGYMLVGLMVLIIASGLSALANGM